MDHLDYPTVYYITNLINVLRTWNLEPLLQTIVDICMKLDEGKYLLVKDPNKPIIR